MLSYSPYDNVGAQGLSGDVRHHRPVGLARCSTTSRPSGWPKLRAMKTDANPLVFRINMEAGHGGKSGRFQRFHDTAEYYAFMLDRLGVEK